MSEWRNHLTPHWHYGVIPVWIVIVNDNGTETGETFLEWQEIWGIRNTGERSAVVLKTEVSDGIFIQKGMILENYEIVSLN